MKKVCSKCTATAYIRHRGVLLCEICFIGELLSINAEMLELLKEYKCRGYLDLCREEMEELNALIARAEGEVTK